MNKALAHDRAEIHLKMFRSIDTEYRELHWRTLSPNTQRIPVCIFDPYYSALLASSAVRARICTKRRDPSRRAGEEEGRKREKSSENEVNT